MAMAKAAEDKQQEKTIAAGQPTKQHKTKQRHKQNKKAATSSAAGFDLDDLVTKTLANNALAAFDQAVKNHPTFADAYTNRALARKARGRLAEAHADYQHVLKLQPTNADVWYNLGVLHHEGRMSATWKPEAEWAYRHAIANHPRDASAQRNLAGLLLKDGVDPSGVTKTTGAENTEVKGQGTITASRMHKRASEAVELYRHSLELSPRSATAPVAWFNLGLALEMVARPHEAELAYEQAATPDDDEIWEHANRDEIMAHMQLVAHEHRGRLLLASQGAASLGRRNAEAVTEFLAVIAVDPKRVSAYMQLATATQALGRFKEAAFGYDHATELSAAAVTAANGGSANGGGEEELPPPQMQDVELMANRGLVLSKVAGREAEAVALLNAAVQLHAPLAENVAIAKVIYSRPTAKL